MRLGHWMQKIKTHSPYFIMGAMCYNSAVQVCNQYIIFLPATNKAFDGVVCCYKMKYRIKNKEAAYLAICGFFFASSFVKSLAPLLSIVQFNGTLRY